MKKLLTIALLATLAATTAITRADPNTTITNWITGYRYIAATNTDVGTTGVATGTAYVCFPAADLTFLTAANAAHTNGDVRALQFALVKDWQTLYAASTNDIPAMLTINEDVMYDASDAADIRYLLNVNARMTLSATGVAIADE